jgi:hypothetical protein
MISQDVWNLQLDFHPQKPIQLEPVQEHLSSDTGLLLFRQLDEQIGLTATFAAQLNDLRSDPDHSILQMVRSRVYGILAGYEDQNDHDALRGDAVFKLLVGRLPDEEDLASQPTLSRFENAVTPRELLNLEACFLQRFVDSFPEPPREITLDIDLFDDPAHGQQQMVLFHGFYKQYQYLVRVITCAENEAVVMPVLLHGTAHAALGADEDLRRVVVALRHKFPDVRIHVRADAGFAVPRMYDVCEELQVNYTIGIGMNPVLKKESETLLAEAVEQYEKTNQPQRLFTMLAYQAGSWTQPRHVAIKCEAGPNGTNRRAVVSNRPGITVLPGGVYEEYADRGESENRNKELKCELCADRLSDHRYMANCFRMFLHCLAYSLLLAMRRRIASPPDEPCLSDPPCPHLEPAAVPHETPAEASTGATRRGQFNRRRQADPLGEGHASTWRMMLIKVAARITIQARRVRVFLSGSWPFLPHFQGVGEALLTGS